MKLVRKAPPSRTMEMYGIAEGGSGGVNTGSELYSACERSGFRARQKCASERKADLLFRVAACHDCRSRSIAAREVERKDRLDRIKNL